MTIDQYLYYIILPVLGFSVVLIFIRFVMGPSLSDRVVALDLVITAGIGTMAVYSVVSDETAYLDVAMILALIAFLGTVAFSYYIEKRKRK